MTDITGDDFSADSSTTATGSAGGDTPPQDAAPARRSRRRAASRPAGPPVVDAADGDSPGPADDAAAPAPDTAGPEAAAPETAAPEAAAPEAAAPEAAAPEAAPAEPADEAPDEAAAPVKRAARKRAPRRARATADAPAATDVSAAPADDAPTGGTPVTADAPAATDATADVQTDVQIEAAADVQDEAPPAKKAARKRAPRKRAVAAQPADVPVPVPGDLPAPELSDVAEASADVASQTPPAGTADADVPPVDATAAPEDEPVNEPVDEVAAAAAPLAVPVLFQAPDPTAAPPRRRRRASAPAGPPVLHDESDGSTPDGVGTDAAPSAAGGAGRPSTDPEAAGTTDEGSSSDEGIADERGTDERGADDSSEDGTPGRKRRRRGGRGRRPRTDEDETGEDSATTTGTTDGERDEPAARPDDADDDATGTSDEGDDSDDSDDDESGSASSRRRRRRRRRSGGGTTGEAEQGEDPPGTVTRVRAPRKAEDEVASVRGSTRLEAKKQRRRDGREAGRRKPTITESEFLARRESVQRTMVVRESAGRTQIAVLEDGVLVEHYVANETNASMIGNVYLGRVQNVLPSMEAAFVDIGKGRNAVLYAGEVNWDAAGMDGQPRRIESALKSGDTVLVQVTKDPMGHKGARLTSQISLPGRYLVYVPGNSMTGISRKLPDTERSRLKRILKEVVPEKAGVIVRTAAEGASEDELQQDVARLTAQWAEIERKAASSAGGSAPKVLYGEPDLTIRVVRDVFNEDFSSLVVSGEAAWSVVQPYLTDVAPDLADRVTRWAEDADVFAEHRIDEQLAKAMDRKVWLPSGGSLVIDRTEAMTVVDVNTGKFTGSGGNLEETVTRNNLEAAEEVVRQLRLRDIGGIIVVDFIDMVLEGNRDLVLRRLLECLGRDRTKHQVAEVTSLGLVQMTRKRVGQGLLEVFSETCEHCGGRGVILHDEPVEKRQPEGGGGRPRPSYGGGS
ncbi:MAG TPA: Rne/Rng family ribonuclease, partial [Actinomycetales bacterium]